MIGAQMVATTLYFPRNLYELLEDYAGLEKKPKAQVVREAVEEKIKKNTPLGNAVQLFSQLQQIQFKGGPKDLALHHTHYAWDEAD